MNAKQKKQQAQDGPTVQPAQSSKRPQQPQGSPVHGHAGIADGQKAHRYTVAEGLVPSKLDGKDEKVHRRQFNPDGSGRLPFLKK